MPMFRLVFDLVNEVPPDQHNSKAEQNDCLGKNNTLPTFPILGKAGTVAIVCHLLGEKELFMLKGPSDQLQLCWIIHSLLSYDDVGVNKMTM